ncbi:hypothetical protein VNO77_39252 [Canavalia gladiata]|uniref:Uncharacterized protein n=1 Tax=Canavalia gladiata TaxID=3824 RepID=A0AAN9PY32_CANGL
MIQLPSSIVMLPELGFMCVSNCEGLQLSSELGKGKKMVSKSSNMEYLILSYCNISDDFLPIGLTLFANVRHLNLSGNYFTALHTCIKECHLLRNLKLDDCRFLREIRGIPEKLETLSITTEGPQKDYTMVQSIPILTSSQPPPAEVEKGLTSQPTLLVERPRKDVEGETSERLPEDDELHRTAVQNDPSIIEICIKGDDIELEAKSSCELESEESSSNSTDSDSDDPFNWVDKKLFTSGKETTSLGESSGDASLSPIRAAIDTLELLMCKDLSEVSSDPATQSQLDHFLDLLISSSYPKVTAEVKEALAEFRRKAFASFQEFQATIESVNKLKNFEKQKVRIQKETSAGKNKRKDLKNSIKKASLTIRAENSRRKELESEIANIRKQLETKEMDLEKLVLNVKNQEAELSTYLKNRSSLDEQARALLKETDGLLAASRGVEYEGEAAKVKQNMLKSTWSTDLPSLLNKIKNKIFGL